MASVGSPKFIRGKPQPRPAWALPRHGKIEIHNEDTGGGVDLNTGANGGFIIERDSKQLTLNGLNDKLTAIDDRFDLQDSDMLDIRSELMKTRNDLVKIRNSVLYKDMLKPNTSSDLKLLSLVVLMVFLPIVTYMHILAFFQI